jgi:hypothetical protein
MPDISMCENYDCPLSNGCFRFLATPNPYGQSYAEFEFITVDDVTECGAYWPIDPSEKTDNHV